jgi:hypothetical protein
MEWKDSARSIMKNAGMPAGFYDSDDDFADLIGVKNLAPTELKERVEKGYKAMMQAPVAVREEMQRLWGVGEGDLAAFFIDPDKGQDLLEKRVAQAQIAGAAKIEGFKGGLTVAESQRLQELGTGFDEARQGFGLLGQQSELLEGSVSEGGDITREQQVGAVGGDTAAREAIKKRGKQRTATFEQGGSFAGGQGGLSGLGTADA